MSQWCDTCSLGKITGRYQSCGHDCPAFGKSFEELAESVIKQREEIDALRWTNKQLIKAEKEKRRNLWKKAIRELVERFKGKLDIGICGYSREEVEQDVFNTIDNAAEEMINQMKE